MERFTQEQRLQTFTLLRRANLGNYEHYEIEITIHDVDENMAMERAVDLYQRTAEALDIREKVEINRLGKRDWTEQWKRVMEVK